MGRGSCDTCRHYRLALERNAPAHALHWLADSGEPEVYEALKQIATEEHERQKGEAERLNETRHAAIDAINDHLREREWPVGPPEPDFWKPPALADDDVRAFNREVKPRLMMLFTREPQTVTHCAVHAARSVFYVADVKNWAETCTDHEPRTDVPRCQRCAFYTKSDLEARQRAEAGSLVTAIGSNDEGAASVLERGASRIDSGIGPAKAHNVKTAHNLRGRLFEPLAYLPYCEAPCLRCADAPSISCSVCHGEGVQRAQPEVFNRFLGCQVFQPAGRADAAPNRVPQGPRAAFATSHPLSPSGAQFVTEPLAQGGVSSTAAPRAPSAPPATTAVAALGLSPFAAAKTAGSSASGNLVESFASEAVNFVFDKLREVKQGVKARPMDPREISADQLTIIVAGRPPLTNEMLRRSIDVAAAVYEGAMPESARREYATFVETVWRRQFGEAIQLQLALINLYDDDRTPTWRVQASRLFNDLVALARKATGGAPVASSAPTEPTAAAAATTPADTGRTCKCGHVNAAGKIFCDQCGKPLS